MADVLRGAPVAAALVDRIAAGRQRLAALEIVPTLAIVRVGERDDDIAYERSAMKRCEKTGVAVRQFLLPADCTQERLLDVIDEINDNHAIHGCLLFRPLPAHICDNTVRHALSPEKDVDGITDGSLAGVFTGAAHGFPPCTARACVEILEHYGCDLAGKRAVVIGRSLVVGKPVAMLLLHRNATVTICHTHTVDMAAICRVADILVVAAGKAGIVGRDHLAANQVVIDVGIHVDTQGGLHGDVDAAPAQELARAITPVPGGVGTVTSTVLAAHVVEAALRQRNL